MVVVNADAQPLSAMGCFPEAGDNCTAIVPIPAAMVDRAFGLAIADAATAARYRCRNICGVRVFFFITHAHKKNPLAKGAGC